MKNLLLAAMLFAALSLHGQSSMWSKKVSKGAFMSQLDDGKIFLKDKSNIYLIDNETGETNWENSVATKDDPRFFENLPIMYFEGKSYAVIDATTGKVIDESKIKTDVLNISYFWNVGRVVVELEREKNLHILNIDLNDLSQSWNTKVGQVQKAFMGLVSRETENAPSISEDGSVILVDKKYISIIDANGSIKKRLEYKKDLKKLGYNQSKNILYVLEDNKHLHFIDVTNGNTNASIELKEKDLKLNVLGDGSTINIVQKKEIRILDGVNGSEKGSHEFKDKVKHAYIDEASGDLFVLSKKLLAQIDHSTGTVLRKIDFEKDFGEIYQVYDKTIISGVNGVNIIDLSTFDLTYPQPAKIPPVHDYVEMENDLVAYTYQIADKFSLHVVDAKGKTAWNKEFSSVTPPSLDVIGRGLLMISATEADYLNMEDGKSRWKDKVKVDPSFTFAIDQNNDMYMYADKRLYKFAYEDGSLLKSKEKFKFKDFDYEAQKPQMMVLDNNVFLKGSNSVFVISKNGTPKHEMHYPRISTGATLMQLANVVVTATAIGTGNAGEVITVYQGDRMVHKGGMVDGLNDNWAYAEGMKAKRRAKQNRSSNAYPYVFTKLSNGKRGLIFLDPNNGKERFDIPIDEKDPDYIVDDIDGCVFYLSDTSLKAYDVK